MRDRIGTLYPVGSKIPSEAALGEEFKVSLSVIRHALGDLVQSGLLVRRRGSGSYVRSERQTRPLALFYPGDLSAKPYPYAELRLMEACATLLEEDGLAYTLLMNRTTGTGKPTPLPSPASCQAAIVLGPLPETPAAHGPDALRLIGPTGQPGETSVRGDLHAFAQLALDHLHRRGCRRIAHFGSPSTWVGLPASPLSDPPPYWSTETLDSLGDLEKRSTPPDAVVISHPEQIKTVLRALPPRFTGHLPIIAAGYQGDPRRPEPPLLDYLDLDLKAIAAGLLHLAESSTPLPGGERRVINAWHLAPR